jgi:RNA polymerase sigma factor (sigma-70 family)
MPGGKEGSLTNAQVADVYGRYAHLILRWSSRFFSDAALAEDLLQEVMMIVMDRGAVLYQLETERARCSWLRTTTFRACLVARRRRERAGQLTRQDDAALQPLQERVAFEERDLLKTLFDSLDGEERMLAVLHYEDGYTKMELKDLVRRSRPFIDKKLKRVEQLLARLENLRNRG